MKKKIFIFLLIILANFFSFSLTDITGKIITSDDEAAKAEIGNKYIDVKAKYSEELMFDGITWKLFKKVNIKNSADEFLFCIYNQSSDYPAMLVFKKIKNDYKIIGGFIYIFGGNGANLDFNGIEVNQKEISIDLECTGHLRGYYIDPNSSAEGNYIYPSDNTENKMLVIKL